MYIYIYIYIFFFIFWRINFNNLSIHSKGVHCKGFEKLVSMILILWDNNIIILFSRSLSEVIVGTVYISSYLQWVVKW